METTVGAVLIIVALAIVSAALPLVGLIALAWAAFKWVGLYGAICIVLCWGRYGPSVFSYPAGWPWTPGVAAAPKP